MRRANVFSGIALRSALAVLLAFAIVLSFAGFAILSTTRAAMDREIQSAITEDVNLLRDANQVGGEGELINFVRDSLATRSDRQFAFGLFKRDGRALAGNISTLPRFSGWGVLDHVGQSDGSRFLAFALTLDDDVVVAAHSLGASDAIARAILTALLVSGGAICVAALGIGYALNRMVSLKLSVIDQTLAAVSQGSDTARIPVGRTNDQIDHVSEQINSHLDRLSAHVTAMRNTIVAIAHDLKSPLNRAYIALQEAANAEPGREPDKIDRAVGELETLRDIVDTVLRISRIGSSDDSSHFVVFSLRTLIEDLAQTFEPILAARDQSLVVANSLGDPDVQVRGDRQMVTQLVVNLIENANRYAGPGATVTLQVTQRSNGQSVLTVADTGPGIPEDLWEEVFEPFRRVEPERNLPGAGLGLALVQAIATRHRAHIALSDNAPGLCVTVVFPAIELTQM